MESARVEEGDDDDGRNSWSASFGVAWIVVFYLTVMVCAVLGICHVAQDHPLSDLLLPLAYLGGLCDVTLVGVAWGRAAAFADPLNG